MVFDQVSIEDRSIQIQDYTPMQTEEDILFNKLGESDDLLDF